MPARPMLSPLTEALIGQGPHLIRLQVIDASGAERWWLDAATVDDPSHTVTVKFALQDLEVKTGAAAGLAPGAGFTRMPVMWHPANAVDTSALGRLGEDLTSALTGLHQIAALTGMSADLLLADTLDEAVVLIINRVRQLAR